MPLPIAVPSVIPSGEYVAEIKADPEEKASQFNPAKTYFEMPLTLQNQRGEYFDFIFSFNPKTPAYHMLLEIVGGEKQPTGFTIPPKESYIGKKFVARITVRSAKNDKNRLVNEILSVEVYKPFVNNKEDKEEKEEEKAQSESEDAPF